MLGQEHTQRGKQSADLKPASMCCGAKELEERLIYPPASAMCKVQTSAGVLELHELKMKAKVPISEASCCLQTLDVSVRLSLPSQSWWKRLVMKFGSGVHVFLCPTSLSGHVSKLVLACSSLVSVVGLVCTHRGVVLT